MLVVWKGKKKAKLSIFNPILQTLRLLPLVGDICSDFEDPW